MLSQHDRGDPRLHAQSDDVFQSVLTLLVYLQIREQIELVQNYLRHLGAVRNPGRKEGRKDIEVRVLGKEGHT